MVRKILIYGDLDLNIIDGSSIWLVNLAKLNGKVEIYSIGTTIGSHTGPGTVALFFWGKERND